MRLNMPLNTDNTLAHYRRSRNVYTGIPRRGWVGLVFCLPVGQARMLGVGLSARRSFLFGHQGISRARAGAASEEAPVGGDAGASEAGDLLGG
jgi:hypothetical protein